MWSLWAYVSSKTQGIKMLELDKIYNMDCIEGMKQIPDHSIDVVIADPPYNISKDSWDKIKDYSNWFISVVKEVERVLKDNGTFWFFHMDFETLAELHQRIIKETNFRHKQLITIDKGKQSIAGRTSDILRSYPRATEYLQFYTFDDPTGARQLSDQYAKGNPIAKYLRDEFKKAKVSCIDVAGDCGFYGNINHGGMVSNWLLGNNIPSKEQYLKMRKYLNYEYLRKNYEDLRKNYEDLRKNYEDLRYTFNLQTGYTDVWKVNFYKESNNGHCTQKPISLMQRIIKTSSKEKQVILDPFVGSGSSAVACKQLNRHFIGFETERKYYDISLKRLMNIPERLDSFGT